jgi:DNA processing protein
LRRLSDQVDRGCLTFPITVPEASRIVPEAASRLAGDLAGVPTDESLAQVAAAMQRDRIRLLREGAPGWPSRLTDMHDPPPFLFFAGDPAPALAAPCVGIVGSRAATATGREISYTLGRDLALAGVTVISGMARGIDGEAHRGALDAGGLTVAVLGTGSDLAYPQEHDSLMRRILERGGTVSEFPPGTPPRPLHFPRRNRILAGLCDVVVIVEGSERSGARSTAEFALDQARELTAVPRDICLPGSVLPNRLIRDGAVPILGAATILELLDSIPAVAARRAGGAGLASARQSDTVTGDADGTPRSGDKPAEGLESTLLRLLQQRPRDLDQIMNDLGSGKPGPVVALLSRWELLGRVERRAGGRYAVRGAESGRTVNFR